MSTSGATARPTRATTSSGSTATACSPTRPCASTSRGSTPSSSSELGGRTEMSEWLLERDLPYRDSVEKAYSTDANIWGATHEAKELELLDRSMELVEPIMGVRFWDPTVVDRARERHRPLRRGLAGGDQRQGVRRSGRARASRRTRSADGTGSACPTRSRTASSRRSARGIYEAPGMALLFIAYERLRQRDPQRGHDRQLPHEGRRLGRLLYEGRWFDPQSLMLRESLQRWIGVAVTGEVTLRLRRGDDYTIARHDAARPSATTRTSCRWSASRTRPSAPSTASAS